MKKIILSVLALLAIAGIYNLAHRAKSGNGSPSILGAATNVSQPFKDAGSKAGFHVYYPTFLPNGYSLDGVTVNNFSNGEIDYAIASTDGSSRFIIAQSPSSTPDSVSGNIMLSPAQMQAAQWNVTNTTINGQLGYLGQVTPTDGGPTGHEDLIYTTQDGVTIEIFDDFGYGQLAQIAQSMQ